MKHFSLGFIFATFIAGANAGCNINGTRTEPGAPVHNPPYTYVVDSGENFDKKVCGDHHIVRFDLSAGLAEGSLIEAKLKVSAYDVDNIELRMVLIDDYDLGYMTRGGDRCWSESEFEIDIGTMIDLTNKQNYTIAVDVRNTNKQCAEVGWVSLELKYSSPTQSAVPSVLPSAAPTRSGAFGDPHFATWAGEEYDFHGICDLVLLHAPLFGNNAGMDIHIRTKRTRQWSFISTAVLRIGESTLEVKGGMDDKYWINGGALSNGPVDFLESISGYSITFSQKGPDSKKIVIDLGEGTSLIIKTWREYVSITIEGSRNKMFANSVGLMGSFPEGKKMARDGITVIENLNTFGQEWQVLSTEANLFHNNEGPQAPSQCKIPSATEMKRRLGESLITKEVAEIACSSVSEKDFDLCVFDVIATNDKDAAGAY